MQVALVCVRGRCEGQSFTLKPDRPLRMQLRAQGQLSGVLEIACDEQGVWVLSNRSQVPSQINGMATQSAVLRPGDRIAYGTQEFEFQASTDSHAAAPSDGVLDLGEEQLSPMEAAEAASRESDDEIPVLGREGHGSGDGRSGRRRRNSRRLSASRKAVIYKQQRRGGFLQRVVAQAFRRKDERQEELKRLERERDEMLRTAGRLALEREGGLGLPRGFLSALNGGQTLTLRREHLRRPELERFRSLHQKLRQLDAEIMGLRASLGLPVIDVPVQTAPVLGAEAEAGEERAFQALDGVVTEDLHAQIDAFEDDEPDPVPKGNGITRVLTAEEVRAIRGQQGRQAAG